MAPSSEPLPDLPARLATLFRFAPADLVHAALDGPSPGGIPRDRRLPRRWILWLLIALGLLGRWSVTAAWLWLRAGTDDADPPSDSALAQARHRLGVAPLVRLARLAVAPLADPATHPDAFYKGLRLLAFDGTCLSLPDSPANARTFGAATNQHGSAGFPQVRQLALCELGTHALLHWLVKPYATGEAPMARALTRHLGPGQLLLLDAAFFGFHLWRAVRGHGTDLLARVQKGPLLTPFPRLCDGSTLAKVHASTAGGCRSRAWRRVAWSNECTTGASASIIPTSSARRRTRPRSGRTTRMAMLETIVPTVRTRPDVGGMLGGVTRPRLRFLVRGKMAMSRELLSIPIERELENQHQPSLTEQPPTLLQRRRGRMETALPFLGARR